MRRRHGLRPLARAGEFLHPRDARFCCLPSPRNRLLPARHARDELGKIGLRAQQRVLAEHTNLKRAEQFEHAVETAIQHRTPLAEKNREAIVL